MVLGGISVQYLGVWTEWLVIGLLGILSLGLRSFVLVREVHVRLIYSNNLKWSLEIYLVILFCMKIICIGMKCQS